MSPDVHVPGSARPSEVVNQEIRALVRASGGWLYGETRARYELLVEEWTVAVGRERMLGDVVRAA